jgi:hypothetical protein
MHQDTIANFPGKIETCTVFFKQVNNPKALVHMMKPLWQQFSQHTFTGMSEWCMAKIVSKGNRLSEILIKTQSSRHGSGNLADFEGMSQSRTIMISLWRQKNLGFIFQPAESLAVQNTITVNLENRTDRTGLFNDLSAP